MSCTSDPAEYYWGGDDGVLDIIQSHSSSLGLSDRIVSSGSLSHDAVLQSIAASDGMLLPALDETFGMAYLESIATQGKITNIFDQPKLIVDPNASL